MFSSNWFRIVLLGGTLAATAIGITLSVSLSGVPNQALSETAPPPATTPLGSEAATPAAEDAFRSISAHMIRRGPAQRALNATPILTREQADSQIADEEFVLGVALGEESRAYPLNMLSDPEREAINDVLADRPLVVTWCGQCQSPAVYARTVDGRPLTFRVSGETVDANLVLEDAETGSRWVQLLAAAVDGPLKGKELKVLPCVWTDWKSWKTAHPATTAIQLSRVADHYRHLDEYGDSPEERRYFNTLQWGLSRNGKARSWRFSDLDKALVVNDEFDGMPIVIVFDHRASTVTAFETRLPNSKLTFQIKDGALIDDTSHSTWDPLTGTATAGPLAGRQLSRVPGAITMVRTWSHFHPTSEVWSPLAN